MQRHHRRVSSSLGDGALAPDRFIAMTADRAAFDIDPQQQQLQPRTQTPQQIAARGNSPAAGGSPARQLLPSEPISLTSSPFRPPPPVHHQAPAEYSRNLRNALGVGGGDVFDFRNRYSSQLPQQQQTQLMFVNPHSNNMPTTINNSNDGCSTPTHQQQQQQQIFDVYPLTPRSGRGDELLLGGCSPGRLPPQTPPRRSASLSPPSGISPPHHGAFPTAFSPEFISSASAFQHPHPHHQPQHPQQQQFNFSGSLTTTTMTASMANGNRSLTSPMSTPPLPPAPPPHQQHPLPRRGSSLHLGLSPDRLQNDFPLYSGGSFAQQHHPHHHHHNGHPPFSRNSPISTSSASAAASPSPPFFHQRSSLSAMSPAFSPEINNGNRHIGFAAGAAATTASNGSRSPSNSSYPSSPAWPHHHGASSAFPQHLPNVAAAASSSSNISNPLICHSRPFRILEAQGLPPEVDSTPVAWGAHGSSSLVISLSKQVFLWTPGGAARQEAAMLGGGGSPIRTTMPQQEEHEQEQEGEEEEEGAPQFTQQQQPRHDFYHHQPQQHDEHQQEQQQEDDGEFDDRNQESISPPEFLAPPLLGNFNNNNVGGGRVLFTSPSGDLELMRGDEEEEEQDDDDDEQLSSTSSSNNREADDDDDDGFVSEVSSEHEIIVQHEQQQQQQPVVIELRPDDDEDYYDEDEEEHDNEQHQLDARLHARQHQATTPSPTNHTAAASPTSPPQHHQQQQRNASATATIANSIIEPLFQGRAGDSVSAVAAGLDPCAEAEEADATELGMMMSLPGEETANGVAAAAATTTSSLGGAGTSSSLSTSHSHNHHHRPFLVALGKTDGLILIIRLRRRRESDDNNDVASQQQQPQLLTPNRNMNSNNNFASVTAIFDDHNHSNSISHSQQVPPHFHTPNNHIHGSPSSPTAGSQNFNNNSRWRETSRRVLSCHAPGSRIVALQIVGHHLFSASSDGLILCTCLDTLELRFSVDVGAPIVELRASPCENYLAAGLRSGGLVVIPRFSVAKSMQLEANMTKYPARAMAWFQSSAMASAAAEVIAFAVAAAANNEGNTEFASASFDGSNINKTTNASRTSGAASSLFLAHAGGADGDELVVSCIAGSTATPVYRQRFTHPILRLHVVPGGSSGSNSNVSLIVMPGDLSAERAYEEAQRADNQVAAGTNEDETTNTTTVDPTQQSQQQQQQLLEIRDDDGRMWNPRMCVVEVPSNLSSSLRKRRECQDSHSVQPVHSAYHEAAGVLVTGSGQDASLRLWQIGAAATTSNRGAEEMQQQQQHHHRHQHRQSSVSPISATAASSGWLARTMSSSVHSTPVRGIVGAFR